MFVPLRDRCMCTYRSCAVGEGASSTFMLTGEAVLDRGYAEVNARISFALIGCFDRGGAVIGDVCCPTLKMRFHLPN